MLMILGLATAAIAALLAFPDTGVGRSLHHWLVEGPARTLSRIRSGKVVFYALLTIVGAALIVMFEAEGLRLFGLMLPDTLVWFALFDVGVFVDALLITGAILATNGLRAVRAQAAALAQRIMLTVRRRASRARRPVRPSPRPSGKPADDDAPKWAGQPAYLAFSMA